MSKIKEKKQYIIGAVFIICFIVGICMGAVMCVFVNESTSSELYEYLSEFLSVFSENTDNWQVTRKAITLNTKLFTAIFISALFAGGYILSAFAVILKGFVTGFTITSFIRFYETKGIWLALCNLPVNIILIPAIIFYCTVSTGVLLKRRKKEKGIMIRYILISVLVYIIFILCAFTEGYITTEAMKAVLQRVLN